MAWYMRLRWRLIGIQLLVVVIGVCSVLIAFNLLLGSIGSTVVAPALAPYVTDSVAISLIESSMVASLQETIAVAVAIAGAGAIVAGGVASWLMWRTLVTPLRMIAAMSQRITDGRYEERVIVPRKAGEALRRVAVNFNEMAEMLENTERQRMTLIGNVTHEIRTPLAGLKGIIEGMEDGIYQPDPKTFLRLSNEMDRLARLVDDIQTVSRVEAAAVNFEFSEFAVEEVIEEVITHLAFSARESDIALTKLTGEQPNYVWADKDRVAQILTNIISNAIRYTPAGGHITLTTSQSAPNITVSIEDDGIGIPTDQLPYIFERFYRVNHSPTSAGSGSGVGLTISRHLAWAMGGELQAESAGLGEGSKFTLTLPSATKNTSQI